MQSPSGVNGLSMLLVEIEQFTPSSTRRLASATPRRTLWSWSRPIMNRSVAGSTVTATPASAKVAARRFRSVRRQRRILAAMAYRDVSAQPVFAGQFADQVDVHVSRAVAGVEMHVDVDVVFASEFEDTADLPGLVGIVVRRGADYLGAALAVPRPAVHRRGDCWSAPPAGTRKARCRSPRRSRGARASSASKLRSSTPGSSSTWVRMRVVPCLMHFSSVRLARGRRPRP